MNDAVPGWQNLLLFKYLWIFATEKCNLSCSYCFFRHRKGSDEISPQDLKVLLGRFPQLQKAEFVISGGEPTLAWPRTKSLINCLKAVCRDKYLLVQTNATLLNESRLAYFKKQKVALEIGFDGAPAVNSRFRKGIRKYLPHIEHSLVQAERHKIPLSATMTVTPSGAHRLFKNYLYLLNCKIKKIEITPQALGRWDSRSAASFEMQYRQAVHYAGKHKLLDTLSLEYDIPLKNPVLDLIIIPEKLLLSNWALLFLPRKLRERYSIGRLSGNNIVFNKSFPAFYLKKVAPLFKDGFVTYRDLSQFYIKEVFKNIWPEGLDTYYHYYARLGQVLKKINQRLHKIRGRHDST